jgi:hypothetical protein
MPCCCVVFVQVFLCFKMLLIRQAAHVWHALQSRSQAQHVWSRTFGMQPQFLI